MPELQNVVQSTTDYGQFDLLTANRDVNRAHVDKLKASFEAKGNLTAVQPILVNEKYQVIDGQHRLTAAEELGLPIYFTVVPGITINEARHMNLLHRQWNSEDFLKTYASEGRRPYIEFSKLVFDYPDFTFSVILAGVHSHQSKGSQSAFRSGELEMFDITEVRERLDKLSELRILSSTFGSRAMAYAYFRALLVQGFDNDLFVKNVREQAADVRAFQGVLDNLRQIEGIYNKNRSINARLRFF